MTPASGGSTEPSIIGYQQYIAIMKRLLDAIRKLENRPELFVILERGGCIPGVHLAMQLKIPFITQSTVPRVVAGKQIRELGPTLHWPLRLDGRTVGVFDDSTITGRLFTLTRAEVRRRGGTPLTITPVIVNGAPADIFAVDLPEMPMWWWERPL